MCVCVWGGGWVGVERVQNRSLTQQICFSEIDISISRMNSAAME